MINEMHAQVLQNKRIQLKIVFNKVAHLPLK